MIRILESCCRYTRSGVHKVGDIVDYEGTFNEKALVDAGFAEYLTEKPESEAKVKEDKTPRKTKEDKSLLQTKEAKTEEAELTNQGEQ